VPNPSVHHHKLQQRIAPLLPSAAEQRAARLQAGRVVIVCSGRDCFDPKAGVLLGDRTLSRTVDWVQDLDRMSARISFRNAFQRCSYGGKTSFSERALS